jgi:predicted ester cyclase
MESADCEPEAPARCMVCAEPMTDAKRIGTAPRASREVASENAVVLNRYYDEVWNGGDLAVLDEVVGRELVGHDPAVGDFGFEQLQQLARAFRVAFPDLRVAAEDVVAERDRIALRFRSEGTFRGELMGAAPTGGRVSWAGLVMYRFTDHRIVEIWMGWDPASLLHQIGAELQGRSRPPA